MRRITLFILSFFFFSVTFAAVNDSSFVIGKGQMPNVAKDKNKGIHLVFGSGDSIMYAFSKNAREFTSPSLIAIVPDLFSFAMRGPQIAATDRGLIVTACTKKGNIYSYTKTFAGQWSKALKVNDVNEVAKEGLMALSADGANVYAVWLSVKPVKGQNVYGAKSVDGGKTWAKNILVYDSPDKTVCECCKPSVVVKADHVYVMFRNWLNGNRDLYLAQSIDGGKTFKQVQKLGAGNWKLNGCPMDGGGLAIGAQGTPETVWRREGKIYTSTPGNAEKEIGEGRGCTIETVNNGNVFAWTENGEVVLINPQGQKKVLGKGNQPVLKALNKEHILCVWENDKQIHASLLLL